MCYNANRPELVPQGDSNQRANLSGGSRHWLKALYVAFAKFPKINLSLNLIADGVNSVGVITTTLVGRRSKRASGYTITIEVKTPRSSENGRIDFSAKSLALAWTTTSKCLSRRIRVVLFAARWSQRAMEKCLSLTTIMRRARFEDCYVIAVI